MGLRDLLEEGSHEAWAKKESILEEKHLSELREEEKQRKGKKKKFKYQEKKARCVMEFGGASGQILTFVSYAQKGVKSDLGFWGYIASLFRNCCTCCLRLICCEVCRSERETDREIIKKKSSAYTK